MTEQEKQKQIEEITNIIGKYDGTEKQDDVIYSQVAYLSIEEIAQTLVNAGYGDTKQAVREFAEKVKELLLANTAPCFNMGAEPIIEFDPFFYDKLDQLVKETCGE